MLAGFVDLALNALSFLWLAFMGLIIYAGWFRYRTATPALPSPGCLSAIMSPVCPLSCFPPNVDGDGSGLFGPKRGVGVVVSAPPGRGRT